MRAGAKKVAYSAPAKDDLRSIFHGRERGYIQPIDPGGVTCVAGCTGTVSYTVCGSAGTAYSVSACQATCTVPTTTGYSVGSATGDVIIANFAPGGVTCTAGCSGTGVTLFADLLVLRIRSQRARQHARQQRLLVTALRLHAGTRQSHTLRPVESHAPLTTLEL